MDIGMVFSIFLLGACLVSMPSLENCRREMLTDNNVSDSPGVFSPYLWCFIIWFYKTTVRVVIT